MMIEAFSDDAKMIADVQDDGFSAHKYHSMPWWGHRAKDERADITIAIIRDPVERAISGFMNRVRKFNDLHLPEDKRPSWREFIDGFHEFVGRNFMMRHHFLPLTAFLGHDPGFFDYVFRTRDINGAFRELLEDLSGRDVGTRNANPDPEPDFDVTDADRRFLRAYYQSDYEAFGDNLAGVGGFDSWFMAAI